MGKKKAGHKAVSKNLRELGDLKDEFAQQIREQQAQRERDRLAREKAQREQRQRERDAQFMQEELADVLPIKNANRVEPPRAQVEPVPRQRELDDDAALRASLSDEIDVAQYLDTDDSLSYTAPGVGPDVAGRLRAGAWAVTAQVDLHGLRRDEAREVLVDFLDDCRLQTKRCVRVIHGKGLGSVNREPILKDKVRKWLVQRPDVLAFCQTRPNDGGSGALLVLLAGRSK